MPMQYMIVEVVRQGKWEHEQIKYEKGTVENEKFTDSRIIRLYPKAIAIYKLYAGSLCVAIKESV